MNNRGTLGRVACLAGALAGTASVSQLVNAVPIFAIDDNPGQHLITFDSDTPSVLNTSYAITGLQPNEKLIGIDFRINAPTPANSNLLYGVGSFGRVYTLNPANGAATFVAGLTDGVNPIILNGTEFGFDFNPQADRLRIVSDLEQNLRVNVDTGVTVVDTPLNPGNPNVTDVAYDRADITAGTATTLYGIDTVANQLVRIGGVDGTPSPNGGTITPVGPMGSINAVSIGGFDIASGSGTAFAALRGSATANGSDFYTINLGTGLATLVGPVGNSEDGLVIKGIAVGPAPGVPEPTSLALLGVGAAGLLARRRRR
jgi:hypothetical protein